MTSATVMKVTKNGQISIPAEVRRRWRTDRVVVFDTPEGLVVRPFDDSAVTRLAGKYRPAGPVPSLDEQRRAERAAEAGGSEQRARRP